MFTKRNRKTVTNDVVTAETSPLIKARVAGLLLLIVAILAPFSDIYVPSTLIVPGDAIATANNIRASEGLFRLGIVSDSLIFLIEIVLTVLLYVLLRPVSRPLSLVAAFARLAMTVVMGVNLLPYFTALLLLSGAGYLTAFEPAQSDALALVFLNAHGYGVYIWQLFFGLHLFVLGYLIFKSGYFPRILGVLMIVAIIGLSNRCLCEICCYPNNAETFGVGCWRDSDHWGTSIFSLAADKRRKRPTLQRTGATTAALGYA